MYERHVGWGRSSQSPVEECLLQQVWPGRTCERRGASEDLWWYNWWYARGRVEHGRDKQPLWMTCWELRAFQTMPGAWISVVWSESIVCVDERMNEGSSLTRRLKQCIKWPDMKHNIHSGKLYLVSLCISDWSIWVFWEAFLHWLNLCKYERSYL